MKPDHEVDQDEVRRMVARRRIHARITLIALPIAIVLTTISVRISGVLGPLDAFALAFAAASITFIIMNRRRRPRDRN